VAFVVLCGLLDDPLVDHQIVFVVRFLVGVFGLVFLMA